MPETHKMSLILMLCLALENTDRLTTPLQKKSLGFSQIDSVFAVQTGVQREGFENGNGL